MDKILKRVKFDIDPNEPINGVKAISLVDEPAILSNFEYFNQAKKVEKFSKFIVDGKEFEGVTHGLVLKPDVDILRYDAQGEAYYGYFTAEVIKKIRDKYHKEMMSNQFNTDHNGSNMIDAYLIESFIVDSPERLADVKAKGIEDVTMGSWYVQSKIEDSEAFQRVVNGELKGFSVEIYLQKVIDQYNKQSENNYKINESNVMKFIQEQFKEIQARLEKLASAKKAELMEKAKIAGSETSVEYGEVGQPASVIQINEAGIESPSPAPAGEHILDNGKAIVVDENGVVVEIKDAPVAPAEEAPAVEAAVEAPLAEVEVEIKPDEAPAASGSTAQVIDEEAKKKEEEMNTLITSLKAELEVAKAEIEKLKKAPIANPISKKEVMNAAPTKDVSKLSTFERLAMKNGIEIPAGLVK